MSAARFFKLRRPCKDCPFRTDHSPFLTPERAQEIADALLKHNQTFVCHKTIDYDDREDDDDGETGTLDIDYDRNTMCAGAEIFVEKIGAPNAMLQIAERFGFRDPKRLDMDAPVFDSAEAFVKAQDR